MPPFIISAIAAERTRDLQRAAQQLHDARLGCDRRPRQRRAPRAAGIVRLLPARLRLHLS
jgi:hypothetical protein